MADFNSICDAVIVAEGGYKLTNIKNDKGGQTYAGISRKKNPGWQGWAAIDKGLIPNTSLVRAFYRENYWDTMQGDSILSQDVADTLYSFGVNAGVKTAIKLAQTVIGVAPDGVIGPKTLSALNTVDLKLFFAYYALAKIARYKDICAKDKTQLEFILGWINRTLEDAK